MKTRSWLMLLLLPCWVADGQVQLPAPGSQEFQVVERGPNHRLWRRFTREKLPDGRVISQRNQYVVLTTGS